MKKQIIKFKLKGKEFVVEARVCDTWFSKIRGLMFKKKSESLLFVFKKPGRYAIHSWFCKKFFCVWFLDGKVIDSKIVFPFQNYIVPKKSFDSLLEVIIDDKTSFFKKGGFSSVVRKL